MILIDSGIGIWLDDHCQPTTVAAGGSVGEAEDQRESGSIAFMNENISSCILSPRVVVQSKYWRSLDCLSPHHYRPIIITSPTQSWTNRAIKESTITGSWRPPFLFDHTQIDYRLPIVDTFRFDYYYYCGTVNVVFTHTPHPTIPHSPLHTSIVSCSLFITIVDGPVCPWLLISTNTISR